MPPNSDAITAPLNQSNHPTQQDVVINEIKTDFLISGTGPVGLSLVLGLIINAPLISITLLDQAAVITQTFDPESDQRMIALSERSIQFFKMINVWDEIAAFSTPIKTVHVSEQKSLPTLSLFAEDYFLEQLGAVVSYSAIMRALINQIKQKASPLLSILNHTKIKSIVSDKKNLPTTVDILSNGERYNINTQYIVAADGAYSTIREQAGIEYFQNDYNQIAIISVIECQKDHKNTAYERFTARGPLALLPVGHNQLAAILTVSRDQHAFWQTASDDEFISEILNRFGKRLGHLKNIGSRQIWPLTLIIPKTVYKDRIFLMGNSAHALHPIAGQGLNLGIRDLIDFIELLDQKNNQKIELTEEKCHQFAKTRQRDILQTVGATDFLVQIFGIDCFPVNCLRTQGILMLATAPMLKHWVAKFGMGLHR